ncbi:SAM-dependent methyltransferase [Lactococcus lactis]|uniref:SAM-dependent methyltransferase n=1 Tax=Lactococcus lactis TaxID=1358 RepID=UPI0021A53C9E|nr:SAM-dependent methyltransferase [Lactococcus lactis]MCT3091381.1 SAM-dependent methyltransferase [Lactococcus lactis]
MISDKCQKFTPEENVKQLLNAVGYTDNLFNKSVLENACGDGNILVEVVTRYIGDAKKNGYDILQIKEGIEKNIYGIEIDEKHRLTCISNLETIAQKNGISDIKWNILRRDTLKNPLPLKFDFVVGNPPYITYQEIDISTRNYIRENFITCKKGKFDYCYAFIESSVSSLNEFGAMAYLIPNSIFKNVFGNQLRNFIKEYLVEILDYRSVKVFPDAITSSSIIILDKKSKDENVKYYDIDNDTKTVIKKSSLQNKWIFDVGIKKEEVGSARFGDYFKVSNSVATLRNELYVLKEFQEEGDYIEYNGYMLEKEVIKRAASPRALARGKNELIIFPYYYDEGRLQRYNEEEFRYLYPNVYKYLEDRRDELKLRDADISSQWFEYGRSQALAHLNREKILISSIFSKYMKIYNLKTEDIPYSGFYIIQKGDIPLKEAEKILKSPKFSTYIDSIGTNANGESMRITVKDIENYLF